MTARSERAIILAAGRGQRLKPITDQKPKCLVSLGGRTLLEWQLGALRAVGLDDVAVVSGYRGSQVRGLAAALSVHELTHFENPDWAESNMVASLRCAREWLKSFSCIVSYGDIVYHPEIVRSLAWSPGEIAIAYDVDWRSLWADRFERPEEDAESFRVENGLVVEIGHRVSDLESVQGQYLGLVKFEPSGWHRAEARISRLDDSSVRKLEMTHLLELLKADGVEVAAVPIRGRWCEVDRIRDLEVYQAKLESGDAWAHDWRF